MSARQGRPDRFFICCGLPKSGTTFLQRTLNLHPQVSCPSEHAFGQLSELVDRLLGAYTGVLKVYDRRTGGQGVTPFDQQVSLAILRSIIFTLAKSSARGKPIYGLNDNSVFLRPRFYDGLLDRAKTIAIIRNPVDQAISAWRHSLRLARAEPQQAAAHLKVLANPNNTLEGYVIYRAKTYGKVVAEFLDYTENRPNFCIVLYESLVGNKKKELRRLFAFLGAETGDEAIDPIVEASTRVEMAKTATTPAFFGVGIAEKEAMVVGRDVRERVLKDCWPILERLGYNLSALMLGY